MTVAMYTVLPTRTEMGIRGVHVADKAASSYEGQRLLSMAPCIGPDPYARAAMPKIHPWGLSTLNVTILNMDLSF